MFTMLLNIVVGTFFAIYAWNNPDSAECYAWPESNAAIINPIGISNAKNVTQQFHLLFVWGFSLSILGLVYSLLAFSYKATKSVPMLATANWCLLFSILGNAGLAITGTVFRYKHPG